MNFLDNRKQKNKVATPYISGNLATLQLTGAVGLEPTAFGFGDQRSTN